MRFSLLREFTTLIHLQWNNTQQQLLLGFKLFSFLCLNLALVGGWVVVKQVTFTSGACMATAIGLPRLVS
jgi:hypothetical protein